MDAALKRGRRVPCGSLLASHNPKIRVLSLEVEAMETMGLLARTAAPLAGAGRRHSGAVRPSASLSFAAAAATRSRGRLGVGVCARSGRSAGARHAVPRGIVASAVRYPLHPSLDSVTCICWGWSEYGEETIFDFSFFSLLRWRIWACCESNLASLKF